MATKKILRIPPELRDWWSEEEARAMLHLDGRQHDAYWNIIKNEANMYGGKNFFKDSLYKAMLNHPIVIVSKSVTRT